MPSARLASMMLLAVCSAATFASATQAPPARPPITGISHVAFRVSDSSAARRFYGTVLGLALRPGPHDRLEYTVGHRQYLRLRPGLPAGEDERLEHLAFATTDPDRLKTYLGDRDIAIDTTARPCEPGAFFAKDPDGHPIEFVRAVWPPPERTAEPPQHALSGRILHAGLIVHDENAAHRFYRDALGFSEIWRGGRREGVTDWVNMRVPDGTDYLEYMLTTGEPDRRQRGSAHHACLLVPDVQDAYETASRRLTEPSGPPNVGRNGRWQLNLFDGDGTRIELMEPFRIR